MERLHPTWKPRAGNRVRFCLVAHREELAPGLGVPNLQQERQKCGSQVGSSVYKVALS